jgi:hypothetical protein
MKKLIFLLTICLSACGDSTDKTTIVATVPNELDSVLAAKEQALKRPKVKWVEVRPVKIEGADDRAPAEQVQIVTHTTKEPKAGQ